MFVSRQPFHGSSIMESRRPGKNIAQHADQINQWVQEGQTNKWMAQQLDCDEKMIRRVRARYGFVGEKPEGTTYLTKLASTDWGHGQAELVKPSTREATELVVFLSDMHFP